MSTSTIRVPSRPWLKRYSASLLLATTAASVWIAVFFAGFLASRLDTHFNLSRSNIGEAEHLRVKTADDSHLSLKVVYEARENIEIRWRKNDETLPTWTLQGEDLVITMPGQTREAELRLPMRLNSLESRQVAVSIAPGVKLDALSLVAGRIDEVQGNINHLEITAGHPNCAEGSFKRTDWRHRDRGEVRVDAEGTQSLKVRAASGRLYLSSLPSLTNGEITVAPGVGLEVNDALLLKRLQLVQLTPEATAQTQWAAPLCRLDQRD
jgi:hypothetical protein